MSTIKNKLAKAGVVVPAYGVVNFNGNAESNRKIFEFAKTVGITSLSANPTRDSFESLDKLVAEFGIAIAIHNHGPGSRYSTLKHILRAVDGRHQLIGACIDTVRKVFDAHDISEANSIPSARSSSASSARRVIARNPECASETPAL